MGNSGLKIKNNIFKILIELFVFDKKKRSIIKARWAKKHLKKYVDAAVLKTLETSFEDESAFEFKNPSIKPDEDIIWQYWHQGRENAPELIKKCLESVEKFEGDKKIVVLSFDTVKDYVKIPEKYYKLLEAGKMKIAHFSDILRLYLLKQYGGAWIDSTIYLTDKIPDNVWDSNFCVVQKTISADLQENRMSCFFIRAKKNCTNISALLKTLEAYWAENDFILNYFMFEHISTMLSDKTLKLKAEWDEMPYLDGETCGKLQTIMDKDFNQEKFNNLKSKTFIHKLTYKKQLSKELSDIALI